MLKFMLPLLICVISFMGIMVLADATANNTKTSHTHNTVSSEHHHTDHTHGFRDVSQLPDRPKLAMEVTEDILTNGWNIRLHTENFTFSPEHASLKSVDNEGHAHIFIDDKKVARAYGHWNYVFGLTPGSHTIRVSLNSNEHETLTINGQPIEVVTKIMQRAAN